MVKASYIKVTTQELSGKEAHSVFMQILDQLTDRYFIDENNRLIEVQEMYHGSDIYRDLGDASNPPAGKEFIVAVCRFERLTKGLCYTFRPHHYHNQKCVECGKEEPKPNS